MCCLLQFSRRDFPFHLSACSPLLPTELVFGLLWNHEELFLFSPQHLLGPLLGFFLVFSSATHIPQISELLFLDSERPWR